MSEAGGFTLARMLLRYSMTWLRSSTNSLSEATSVIKNTMQIDTIILSKKGIRVSSRSDPPQGGLKTHSSTTTDEKYTNTRVVYIIVVALTNLPLAFEHFPWTCHLTPLGGWWDVSGETGENWVCGRGSATWIEGIEEEPCASACEELLDAFSNSYMS